MGANLRSWQEPVRGTILGRHADALKIFQTVKPKQLEDPGIVGYYGLILHATGDKAKARVYLDWAFKGSMLPEEKKLFARAKQG